MTYFPSITSGLVYKYMKLEWGIAVLRRPHLHFSDPGSFKDMHEFAHGTSGTIPVGRDTFNRTGVCCMSKCGDSSKMWSEYAGGLNGCCIAFHAEKLSAYAQLYAVRYVRQKAYVPDLLAAGRVEFAEIILTKLTDYSDEQEVRAIVNWADTVERDDKGWGSSKKEISHDCIHSIAVGASVQESDLTDVRHLASLNAIPVHTAYSDLTSKVTIEPPLS